MTINEIKEAQDNCALLAMDNLYITYFLMWYSQEHLLDKDFTPAEDFITQSGT